MNPFSLTYVSGSFGGSVCSWFWDFVWGWRTLLTRSVIPLKGNHLYEQADSATQKPVNKPASIQHTRQYHHDNYSAATYIRNTHVQLQKLLGQRERKTEREGTDQSQPTDNLMLIAHKPGHFLNLASSNLIGRLYAQKSE